MFNVVAVTRSSLRTLLPGRAIGQLEHSSVPEFKNYQFEETFTGLFERYGGLVDAQHGFQPRHRTDTVLLQLLIPMELSRKLPPSLYVSREAMEVCLDAPFGSRDDENEWTRENPRHYAPHRHCTPRCETEQPASAPS